MKLYKSIHYNLRMSKLDWVERALQNKETMSICLNDTANCPDDEFYAINCELQRILNQKYPLKSSFENER